MGESENGIDILWNWLAGVFNQDIDSPEQALEEWLMESTEKELLGTLEAISRFLHSDMPEQAKSQYIEANAFIYFPALGVTPIRWLTEALGRMEEEQKRRESTCS